MVAYVIDDRIACSTCVLHVFVDAFVDTLVDTFVDACVDTFVRRVGPAFPGMFVNAFQDTRPGAFPVASQMCREGRSASSLRGLAESIVRRS